MWEANVHRDQRRRDRREERGQQRNIKTERHHVAQGAQRGGSEEGVKKKKKGQRTTGHGRSQSCAHFFSRPNPKTLLCPPKINYPPYSKNETAMNKEVPRRTVPGKRNLCPPPRFEGFSGLLLARYALLNFESERFSVNYCSRFESLRWFVETCAVDVNSSHKNYFI